jgi:hypothetical protein
MYSGTEPALPQLEWTNAVGDTWIGRLPVKKAETVK